MQRLLQAAGPGAGVRCISEMRADGAQLLGARLSTARSSWGCVESKMLRLTQENFHCRYCDPTLSKIRNT
jgi:hypothetical protein